jgi:hypothetical protein
MDVRADGKKSDVGNCSMVGGNMFFSPDMKDLLGLFEKHQVKYALVGGFAVNFYGYMRTTAGQ